VVEALGKVLAVETGPLAVAAARALGASSDHAAEAPLLEALQRKRPDIPVAAAEALGRVGSATAVPSLKDAAEGSSDGAFRSAARQAIAEIQARLGGATPGQLSLAEGEAGQLSLPEASSGRLSITGSDE
jgi:HEAT repeat protein